MKLQCLLWRQNGKQRTSAMVKVSSPPCSRDWEGKANQPNFPEVLKPCNKNTSSHIKSSSHRPFCPQIKTLYTSRYRMVTCSTSRS